MLKGEARSQSTKRADMDGHLSYIYILYYIILYYVKEYFPHWDLSVTNRTTPSSLVPIVSY